MLYISEDTYPFLLICFSFFGFCFSFSFLVKFLLKTFQPCLPDQWRKRDLCTLRSQWQERSESGIGVGAAASGHPMRGQSSY